MKDSVCRTTPLITTEYFKSLLILSHEISKKVNQTCVKYSPPPRQSTISNQPHSNKFNEKYYSLIKNVQRKSFPSNPHMFIVQYVSVTAKLSLVPQTKG